MLIIGDNEREKIKKLIEYAINNPFSLDYLKKVMAGRAFCAGEMPNHILELNNGYRCVLSFEDQELPNGLCKHLSVSVDTKGKYPSPYAINMIMREFGFKGTVDCFTGIIFMDREQEAINLIQRIDLQPIK